MAFAALYQDLVDDVFAGSEEAMFAVFDQAEFEPVTDEEIEDAKATGYQDINVGLVRRLVRTIELQRDLLAADEQRDIEAFDEEHDYQEELADILDMDFSIRSMRILLALFLVFRLSLYWSLMREDRRWKFLRTKLGICLSKWQIVSSKQLTMAGL